MVMVNNKPFSINPFFNRDSSYIREVWCIFPGSRIAIEETDMATTIKKT